MPRIANALLQRPFKLALIGKSVGKTSLLRSLRGEEVLLDEKSTLGVEVSLLAHEGTFFNVWDCGGTYRGLGYDYCIESDAIVVVYDARENTLEEKENVRALVQKAREFTPHVLVCGVRGDHHIMVEGVTTLLAHEEILVQVKRMLE